MSREFLIRLTHGLRFVEACPAGTHFLPVSPTPDDVCCLGSANFCTFFDRRGRVLFFDSSLVHCQGAFLTCTVGQFLSAFYLGWLAAPLTHLLFGFWPVSSRDANPGWGDWCRSRGGWGCFGFLSSVSSNCESVSLLVTRLG